MDDLEPEPEPEPELVPMQPRQRKSGGGKTTVTAFSQPAEHVHADDEDDFEGDRPRRRACASQVWKLQPKQPYSMKKTAQEFLFYEINST